MMQKFLSRCKDAAERLKGKERITVFGHRDADGICASVIIKRCLSDKDVNIIIIRHSTDFSKLASQCGDSFPVFVDYGSSELRNIEKHFDDFMVLDHHPTKDFHPKMVNPWEYGIDGTRDLSGAGVAYLVAREVDPANRSLSGIAIIGAMGDKIYLSGFGGPSRLIIEEGLDSGAIISMNGNEEILLGGLAFSDMPLSALEIANVIDSCASVNKPDLGVAMMLGDRKAYSDALSVYRDYNDRFNRQLDSIISNKEKTDVENSQHLAYFIYLDHIEPGFTGSLAEELILGMKDRPIVLVSNTPYGLKASARATRGQVDAGVDLGRAMALASSRTGGKGGGHDIAAGASFDADKYERFKILMTLELFRQIDRRLKIMFEAEMPGEKEASSLSSSLAVDNEKYRSTSSIALSLDNKLYIMVLSEDIGTFKNTVDDLIVCLTSCKDIVNISRKE